MLCEVLLVLGLTANGACGEAPAPSALPGDDAPAWSYKEPPPPPPPAPAPQPERVVERIIIQPAPAPPPPPPPVVEAPPPEPPALDPMVVMWGQYMAAANAWRDSNAGRLAALPGPVTPRAGRPEAPAPPLPAVSPHAAALDLQPMGAATGSYKHGKRTSGAPVDNQRILAADRYINGVLETGVNSQVDGASGGPLVIQVSQNIFGYHGRAVLIPKGSRLVCQYKSPSDMGSSRLPVRCNRILLGESRAEIYQLKASASDQQARLGLTGDVDNRFLERYGTAFALAGISAAVRMGAASSQTSESLATQSNAITTGAEELSQRLGEITAAALEKSLDLKPIITIPQGTRIVIRPSFDWYLAPPGAPEIPEDTVVTDVVAMPNSLPSQPTEPQETGDDDSAQ